MAMEYQHQTNYKCYNEEMKENYYNDIFMRSYNSGGGGGGNILNQYDSPYQTKSHGWEQLQEPCSMAIATPPLASNQTQLTWGVDNPGFNTWDVHSCLPTPPLETEQPMHQQHSSNSRQKPMSKWKLKQERERLTLPQHVIKKRRLDANARERKRMTNLNNAFARLKAVLPPSSIDTTSTTTDNKSQAEMSKMETLRTAQAYILQLASMLN